MEWSVYHLQHWALFDLLRIAGGFSLLLVGFQFCSEADDRERRWLYETWSVVDRGLDRPAHAGRNAALQDLAERGFSLAGLQLPAGAWLEEVDLRGADLRNAGLDSVWLSGADLSCRRRWGRERCTRLAAARMENANLNRADLSGADLGAAELRGAALVEATLKNTDFTWSEAGNATFAMADLTGAIFREAELAGAVFTSARLVGADFRGSDLRGAYLVGADLTRAELTGANLLGADLGEIANWREIDSIWGALVAGVCNAPPGFIMWALAQGATLDTVAFRGPWEERRPVDPDLKVRTLCGVPTGPAPESTLPVSAAPRR